MNVSLLDTDNSWAPVDERELIEYYFNCGYSYEVILEFLDRYHDISISLRTLKRRPSAYSLKRKKHEVEVAQVRNLIKSQLIEIGWLG